MAWASKRETTRVEDIAYYLLGVFNVNMPLLYGEGEKAFIRLQEEIIKVSSDESIFAWRPGLDRRISEPVGVLAPNPRGFANLTFTKLMGNSYLPDDFEATPYMITNRGLQMRVYILPFEMPTAALTNLPAYHVAVVGILRVIDGKRWVDLGLLVRKSKLSSLCERWFNENLGTSSLQ